MSEENRFKQAMQPWPEIQQQSRDVKIQDIDLNLFFFEDGKEQDKNLLMIHGLGDEADTWRHVIKPLSKYFHVFALDLPGFGRSDKPQGSYTPKFIMDAILGFMDQLNLTVTILMGSSLGGILSHAIALKHPERIIGLILVDGALLQIEPMGDWSLKLMQIPLMGEWLYTRLRKNPQAAFDSLRNVYYDLDNLPEADRDFLFHRVNQRVWNDEQRRAYFSTLRNLTPWVKAVQTNLPDALSRMETPTLVIRGEHDPLFGEKTAQGITKVQPNASYKRIEGSGHLPHQEKPQEFLNNVIDWMQRIYEIN